MMNLQGIELRYVLTMHLSVHGRATIAELIEALGCMVSASEAGPRKRCRMHCVGRWDGAECIDLGAACTDRGISRAPPNTGITNACCRYVRQPACGLFLNEVLQVDAIGMS
jgi:hypothetical protein